jgi:hypothetical protein
MKAERMEMLMEGSYRNIYTRLYEDDLEKQDGNVGAVAALQVYGKEGNEAFVIDSVDVVHHPDGKGQPYLDIWYTVQ